MLMVVSDKTTVLMESTASGTETERKFHLLSTGITRGLFVVFIEKSRKVMRKEKGVISI